MTSEPTPLSAEERARRYAREVLKHHPLTSPQDECACLECAMARLILEQERALALPRELIPDFVEHFTGGYVEGRDQCQWCLWVPGRDWDPVHSTPDRRCLLVEAQEWVRALKGAPDAD